MDMNSAMVRHTNKRKPSVFLAVNIYVLLVFANSVSSLQIERAFERRANFDGAVALSRTILLRFSSPSLMVATSVCSTLSPAVALLYHGELNQCYCLDERILPGSLRVSSDRSWMYYEIPGKGGCARAMESYKDHLYCFHLRSTRLEHAKSNCSSIGGYLTEIDDSAENRWISQRLSFFFNQESCLIMSRVGPGIRRDWWSGGNDEAREGKYEWGASGRGIVYNNWVSPEPNGGPNENCITVDYQGHWATVDCGLYHPYICEV